VPVGLEIVTLPAMGWSRDGGWGFLRGFWNSYRAAKRVFHARPPQAVLAMGGFHQRAAVLAGKGCGAATFLHESNIIPGKANRWLARVVDQAFVGFPSAAGRLFHRNAITTGTPVRPQFQPGDAGGCRTALGLDPERPVLLVTGGSQGASGVNELVLQALPILAVGAADLQWVHLTGINDFDKRSAPGMRPKTAKRRASVLVRNR